MSQSDENRLSREKGRLITVSNRLPVVLNQDEDGSWSVEQGSGGLVTALVPVLRDRGGLWIGWTGVAQEEANGLREVLEQASRDSGYQLKSVMLTPDEYRNFYLGFSNEIVWPMFHDLHTLCNFDPEYWRTYQNVNQKYAQAIFEHAQPSDYVWIHDYHLMCTAAYLKDLGSESPAGFFLHIPFPSLDIFLLLPWRLDLLRMLLKNDFIGFQTQRDQRNFLACVEALVPDVQIEERGRIATVRMRGREIRLGYFPISIDFEDFARSAARKEVAEAAWYIHEELPEKQIILGVDRLDYTKGLPYRLRAFGHALDIYPELRESISLVQVVVPSRETIREYASLKEEVEQLVGEINGRYTQSGWVPIHYIFRSLDRTELLAYYRMAEIALVTPIKDGMNLVSKEYCACNLEENGVLILSEFAGSADQLQDGALLVNPFDIEGTAEAIYQAFTMDIDNRMQRMKALRETVREQDIFWWVDSFLDAAIAKRLAFFPVLKEYVPKIDMD